MAISSATLQRMVAEADRVAEDHDPGLARPAGEGRGDDVRRGHDPVGRLVVLVAADPVEAEPVCVLELVEVAVVELVTELGIEVPVWEGERRAVEPLVEVSRQVRVGHQVEEVESHLEAPACTWAACSRKRSAGSATRAGSSTKTAWPAFSITSRRRARDSSRIALAVRPGHDLVIGCCENERRNGDPAKAAFELGVVHEGVPCVPRQSRVVPVRLEDELDIGLGGKDRGCEARVVEQGLDLLGGCHVEEIGDRVLRDTQPYRGNQHKRLEAMWRVDGELRGQPTAERGSDERHALESEPVEKLEVVVHEVVNGLDERQVVGLAETGMVGSKDFEAIGKQLMDRKPDAGDSASVEEEERRALTTS